MDLKITSIKVRQHQAPKNILNGDKLKAFVSVVFNEALLVKEIKIIEGPNGLFVAMPSRQGKDGMFRDIAHPISQEVRDYLENEIIQAYKKESSGNESGH